MKKTLRLLLLLVWLPAVLHAQTPAHSAIDINNIDAGLNADGSLFWDFSNAQFTVPKGGQTNAIFAAALWMGGIDAGGNLHMSAQTYRQTGTDFWPGPLDGNGTTNQSTSDDWNFIWGVTRQQINTHILDYADNGAINGTIPNAILHWPAIGNADAQGAGGASLTIAVPMAPFVDINGDGIYTPRQGDYPLIKGDEAQWWVYNDTLHPHTETGGRALGVEVHAMAYAFACSSDDALDNTIFIQYDIINKSANDYHNFQASMWTDFDLGCFNNDYVGSNPALDYYYAYNGVDNDTSCASTGYGTNLGTIATIVMKGMPDSTTGNNNGLSSFNYYDNDFTVTGNPVTDVNFYNYMSGFWKDGSPMTSDRCNAYGGSVPTKYMFPDAPNGSAFPLSWSECSCSNIPADRRGLGSTSGGKLLAGETVSLTFAFGYFNHGTQTNCAAPRPDTEVQHIRDLFDNNFQNACSSCISDTCVWPGDANHDGVANNMDILELGIAAGSVGPMRPGANILWTGQSGTPWGNLFANGTNYQHADCDGNGTVDIADTIPLSINYGFTHLKTEITAAASAIDPRLFINAANDTVTLSAHVAVPIHLGTSSNIGTDVYGIAFTIDLDESLIKPNSVSVTYDSCWLANNGNSIMTISKYFPDGRLEVGISRTGGQSISAYGNIATVHFITTDNLSGKDDLGVTLLPMSISQVKIIDAQEQPITVNLGFDTLIIKGVPNGLAAISKELDANIFPNPTQGLVNIALPSVTDGTEVKISVFSSIGGLAQQVKVPYHGTLVLPLEALPAGIYFIQIQAGNNQASKRITIF